jgi:hypothetical protein
VESPESKPKYYRKEMLGAEAVAACLACARTLGLIPSIRKIRNLLAHKLGLEVFKYF